MASNEEMVDACRVWQSERDGGSTPIRAAARVLTGVPHYFSLPFIEDLDRKALGSLDGLRRAFSLLEGVAKSEQRPVEEWRQVLLISGDGLASRGIKPNEGADQQIEQQVATPGAHLTMPLWGFSLSESVARSYGERFLFRINGPFSAIPAWTYGGSKQEQEEMIGGGVYRVLQTTRTENTLIVDLEQSELMIPDAERFADLLSAAEMLAGSDARPADSPDF